VSRSSGGRARIGLFGGSFDPVHAGHLHAARAALRAFDLDRVVFVPARRPPHKPGRELAPGADRMEMLRLALRGEPRFEALGIELDREGPSYTIDTVRELPAALGEDGASIHLILGSDNLEGLPTWREAAALLERVQPVVVHRGGDPAPSLGEIERALGRTAAERVRAGYLELPPVDASSTGVRARIRSTGGRSRDLELDPSVLDYIRERGLYGAGR
jgi:nicotinate-nucleotide adenylyltransferase